MDNNYKVYMHKNKTNAKVYIGVTKNTPKQRWGNKGQKYKNQKYFWRAIEKYGWGNFEHGILFDNLSKNEAFKLEKKLIKIHNSNNRDYGYNITSGGIGGCGLCGELNAMYGISPIERMNEETYKKWLIKHQMQEHKENCKKVICLTTNKVFESIKSAEKYYAIQDSDIASCCNDELYSAGKHPYTNEEMIWQFYDDYINKKEKSVKQTTQIYCITTGEIFKTAIDAAKKYKLSSCNITLCCQDKIRYVGLHDGIVLQWMYYEDYLNGKSKEIIDKRVICLNDKKIYKDMADAEKCTGIIHSNISQCCNGKTSYAGYIDGEKAIWARILDYKSGDVKKFTSKKTKKVRCKNDGNVFNSMKLAKAYYGIKRSSGISECCRCAAEYVYDRDKNKLFFEYD